MSRAVLAQRALQQRQARVVQPVPLDPPVRVVSARPVLREQRGLRERPAQRQRLAPLGRLVLLGQQDHLEPGLLGPRVPKVLQVPREQQQQPGRADLRGHLGQPAPVVLVLLALPVSKALQVPQALLRRRVPRVRLAPPGLPARVE